MTLLSSSEIALLLLTTLCWTFVLGSNEDPVDGLLNDKIISASNYKPSLQRLLMAMAKITNDDIGDHYPLYPALKKKGDRFFNLLPKRSNNPSSGNNGMLCHFKLCNLGRRR